MSSGSRSHFHVLGEPEHVFPANQLILSFRPGHLIYVNALYIAVQRFILLHNKAQISYAVQNVVHRTVINVYRENKQKKKNEL